MRNIEKMMSPRMMMIADAVKPCGKVYDAGSDHAFIPIYLIQRGQCKAAIASDIRIGPIKVSEKNIKKYDLEEEIQLSVCDGIANAADCDCIIIAGMGGQMIVDILKREPGIAKSATTLVLQPMNAPEKLRKHLWDNGYNIYFENLCSEKHKVYNVMCAEYTGETQPYDEVDLHASLYLVENNHAMLHEYMKPKIKRLSDMIKGGNDPDLKNSRLLSEIEELII